MRRRGYVDDRAVIGEPAQDRSSPLHPAIVNEVPTNGGPWRAPCPGVVIHGTATVEALAQVDAGTRRPTLIGPDVWLMKTAHVGHDARIGERVELTPGVVVCGWVEIGNDVRVGVGAVFRPYVKVGDGARIGAGAVVVSDVPAGQVWVGNPARFLRPTNEHGG